MKKVVILIVLAIYVSVLVGCSGQDASPNVLSSSEKSKQETASESLEKQSWSETDINALFTEVQQENWESIDCALISDHAYDRVGAVLFQDVSKGTCNVAFFDDDGHYQQCGVYAKLAEKPNFTYLGDGTVSFQLETEEGSPYTYTISFSMEENQVYFKAESDLYNG